MKRTSPIFLTFILIITILSASCSVNKDPNAKLSKTEYERKLQESYSIVCTGKNVVSNPSFSSSNDGVHPIIAFNENGKLIKYFWNQHETWKPVLPQSAELTLCSGIPTEKRIRTCNYTKSTHDLFQNTFPMTLREINSGKVVAQKDFQSTGTCPQTIISESEFMFHGNIPWTEVYAWLQEFVE